MLVGLHLRVRDEGFDLVEFARAEVAGFGVRVDDRVGDDAHAVLPRNKRPPVGDRYPVCVGGGDLD